MVILVLGKTTLLNILAKVIKPDSGVITGIQGRRISYVFQDDRLLSWLSVRKNLEISNILSLEELEYLLEYFEIKTSENKLIKELSGGMKRKVDLIKAILFDGDIFILDEPFNGIDDKSKEKIINLLLEKAKSKLIIIVTHDLNDAKKFGTIYDITVKK